MLKSYYHLTKPGIVYGNVLVAIAAFVYAGGGWIKGIDMSIGLACVIASACVFNNVMDRDIDAKMERTKTRAMVRGSISTRNALLFGAILMFFGTVILLVFTTVTALLTALAGFFVYVFLYTPLKPRSPLALFVGAIAGATPPVVGYAAVTNALDSTAGALFMFLFVWQIPHFLAIAVYRSDEYVSAGVPLFMKGPYSEKKKKIARVVFYLSLVILLAWCLMLILQR